MVTYYYEQDRHQAHPEVGMPFHMANVMDTMDRRHCCQGNCCPSGKKPAHMLRNIMCGLSVTKGHIGSCMILLCMHHAWPRLTIVGNADSPSSDVAGPDQMSLGDHLLACTWDEDSLCRGESACIWCNPAVPLLEASPLQPNILR